MKKDRFFYIRSKEHIPYEVSQEAYSCFQSIAKMGGISIENISYYWCYYEFDRKIGLEISNNHFNNVFKKG